MHNTLKCFGSLESPGFLLQFWHSLGEATWSASHRTNVKSSNSILSAYGKEINVSKTNLHSLILHHNVISLNVNRKMYKNMISFIHAYTHINNYMIHI